MLSECKSYAFAIQRSFLCFQRHIWWLSVTHLSLYFEYFCRLFLSLPISKMSYNTPTYRNDLTPLWVTFCTSWIMIIRESLPVIVPQRCRLTACRFVTAVNLWVNIFAVYICHTACHQCHEVERECLCIWFYVCFLFHYYFYWNKIVYLVRFAGKSFKYIFYLRIYFFLRTFRTFRTSVVLVLLVL